MIRVVEAGLACCGVEAGAVDLVAHAAQLAGLPDDQTAHVLVVAGTVTQPLGPVVAAAYEQLARPRVVVAFGACAISGGPYWDSYAVLPGVSQVVPVDINVPGCPPTPTDLAAALSQAAALAQS
jgi:NADH-quinone oxidoreductase subunit B